MRTWKNRRHPSKPRHKTRSRKQRGGAGVAYNAQALITKRNALDSKQKLGEALSDVDNQLLNLLTRIITNNQRNEKGDVIVTSQDSTLLGRFGIEQNTVEFEPLNPMFKTPAQRAEEAAALASQNADSARPALLAQAEKLRAQNAARNAARTSGLTVRGVPAPPELPPPPPAPEAPPAVNPKMEQLRAQESTRNLLQAAPGQGMPIYSMTGPDGENRTVSKCEETLAALRKELAGLKSKISTDSAEREGVEAGLNAQIDDLNAKKEKYKAKARGIQEALDALKVSSDEDAAAAAAALDVAKRDAAAMTAEQQKAIDQLRADIAGKEKLTDGQKLQLADITGQLKAAADAATDSARDAADQISRLQAAHAAELARIKGEYDTQLAALTGQLASARDSLADERGSKKKELTDQINDLQGKVDAQKAEIGRLGTSLRESGEKLEQTVADATAAGNAATAAAADAASKAAAAGAKLDQLTAANATLKEQLDAAKAEEAAAKDRADAAGISSDEAKAAADAARSAQVLAEAAAAAANAEAERAKASRGISEADKARLAREAESAAAAAATAKDRADAADASAAAKAGELAAAVAGLSDAEARLKTIKESVPLIIQIVGSGGDKVGGDGGRPTQLGEKLKVTWQPGANVPLAWVFVLFRDRKPEYTQLLTEDDVAGFDFESTVAGNISATIFDVVMHSSDQLLGR
jgi:chromosome segregation ATPase